QPFQINFDSAQERIVVSAPPLRGPNPPNSLVPQQALDMLRNGVKQKTDSAVTDAQHSLDQVTNGKKGLVQQLQTFDDKADAHFFDATFNNAGFILWGWISVARRHRPELSFKRLDADMFSAYESWIPGGRIDKLEWSWTWWLNEHA